MVRAITVDNVNAALQDGFYWLKVAGVREKSRNGEVIVAPSPVVTTYLAPTERVLFHPVRDANPVFHLMEAIWMIAGESKVDWLLQFNSQFDRYAEDDGTVHGAYGWRWRNAWSVDQIQAVIHMLRKDPTTRRAVIAMWNPELDLGVQKNDLPCNTHIYFNIRDGMLDMTVCCRSNDILWGAYGANAVHMSVLQEIIAAGVGVAVGVYHQFSNNFHAYTDLPVVQKFLVSPPTPVEYYAEGEVEPMPLIAEGENVIDFILGCQSIVRGSRPTGNVFLQEIAEPLARAYVLRKSGERVDVGHPRNDWVRAYSEWCDRRANVSE